MDWFNSILDTANDVGKWMEKNETAANILGGAVSAGAQYYTSKEASKDEAEQEEKMYERRLADELSMSKASTGSVDDYKLNLAGGTGLLTNGLLTKKE